MVRGASVHDVDIEVLRIYTERRRLAAAYEIERLIRMEGRYTSWRVPRQRWAKLDKWITCENTWCLKQNLEQVLLELHANVKSGLEDLENQRT